MAEFRLQQQIGGNCPPMLLSCAECHKSLGSLITNDLQLFDWCRRLECTRCKGKWYICVECTNVRGRLSNPTLARRHQKTKHNASPPNVKQVASPEKEKGTQKGPIAGTFHNAVSQAYFENDVFGRGMHHLVANAAFQQSKVDVNTKDCHMLMTVAHFCSTLSRHQRSFLGDTLLHATSCSIRHLEPSKKTPTSKSKEWIVKVPTSAKEIRSTIVDGKWSLFDNLPQPPIQTLLEHTYIFPSDCVLDFFGHGYGKNKCTKKLEKCDGLSRSKKVQEIAANLPDGSTIITATIWSDDFEPNYSKSNRGSLWIKTLSLSHFDESELPISHVYPVAVGKKGDDHEGVEMLLRDDMLNNFGEAKPMTVYNGSTKSMETIYVIVATILGDQPEKRSSNKLLLGGGLHHSRWGWSIDVGSIYESIPACPNCLTSMLNVDGNSEWHPLNCEVCNNWMIKFPHETLIYPPPPNFPADELTHSPMLTAFRLTYDILREAVSKSHQKIVEGKWTKIEAKAYLSVYCINADAQEKIVSCAQTCRAWNMVVADEDEDSMAVLVADKAINPDQYKPWAHPAAWSLGLHMQDTCEAPMHLLFLGLMKSLVFKILHWASCKRQNSSLRKMLLSATTKVEKVKISWCKVMSFQGDKLGAWVSENYLGFARIVAWVSSTIMMTKETTEEYVPPTKLQSKWTGKENKLWLLVRGLDTSGNALELRTRVASCLAVTPVAPILPPHGATNERTYDMIRSFAVMISYLMSCTSVNDVTCNVTERLIRIFLTKFELWEREHRQTFLPTWASSYNYMCLLNIPEQMRRLGPVRNRWEGSFRGEGFLRNVKPAVGSHRRRNWGVNLMETLCRQKTLLSMKTAINDAVLKDDDNDTSSNEEEVLDDELLVTSNCVIYNSYARLANHHRLGDPLSIIIVEPKNEGDAEIFYCVYRKQGAYCGCRLFRKNEDASDRFEFDASGIYFEFVLEGRDMSDNEFVTNMKIITYGLMLPYIGAGLTMGNLPHEEEEENSSTTDDNEELLHVQNSTRYTCVDMLWRELSSNGRMVSPHMNTRIVSI